MLCFIFYGLLIVNVVAFVIFALDKSKAYRGRRRISEAFLMSLCVLGGSVGALMAMSLFRHKTQKRLFRIGVPLMLLAYLILLAWRLWVWITNV